MRVARGIASVGVAAALAACGSSPTSLQRSVSPSSLVKPPSSLVKPPLSPAPSSAPVSNSLWVSCARAFPLAGTVKVSSTAAYTWFRGTVRPTGRTVVDPGRRNTTYVLTEYAVDVGEAFHGTLIPSSRRHLLAYSIGGTHGRASTETYSESDIATAADGTAFGELYPSGDANGRYVLDTVPATASALGMAKVGCWSSDSDLYQVSSAKHPLPPTHRVPAIVYHSGIAHRQTLRVRWIPFAKLRAALR